MSAIAAYSKNLYKGRALRNHYPPTQHWVPYGILDPSQDTIAKIDFWTQSQETLRNITPPTLRNIRDPTFIKGFRVAKVKLKLHPQKGKALLKIRGRGTVAATKLLQKDAVTKKFKV